MDLIKLYEDIPHPVAGGSLGTGAAFKGDFIAVLTGFISAKVTEEINGSYIFEGEYSLGAPYSDELRADSDHQRLIECYANTARGEGVHPQLFRIVSVKKTTSTKIKIKAEHISYDLAKYIVKPMGEPIRENIRGFLRWIGNGNIYGYELDSGGEGTLPFIFTYDLTYGLDDKDINFTQLFSLREWIGKEDYGILATFGGEVSYDNEVIKFNERRGSNTANPYKILYGKNIKSYTHTVDGTTIFRAVIPYYKITLSDGTGRSAEWSFEESEYVDEQGVPIYPVLDPDPEHPWGFLDGYTIQVPFISVESGGQQQEINAAKTLAVDLTSQIDYNIKEHHDKDGPTWTLPNGHAIESWNDIIVTTADLPAEGDTPEVLENKKAMREVKRQWRNRCIAEATDKYMYDTLFDETTDIDIDYQSLYSPENGNVAEELSLGDKVYASYAPGGWSVTKRITSITYDVLRGRYDKIVLKSSRDDIITAIANTSLTANTASNTVTSKSASFESDVKSLIDKYAPQPVTPTTDTWRDIYLGNSSSAFLGNGADTGHLRFTSNADSYSGKMDISIDGSTETGGKKLDFGFYYDTSYFERDSDYNTLTLKSSWLNTLATKNYVTWDNVGNKPSTFPPSTHVHDVFEPDGADYSGHSGFVPKPTYEDYEANKFLSSHGGWVYVSWTNLTNKPTLGALSSLDTIDYTSNYITNKPAPYTLPVASSSVLGGVKIDNDTIKLNSSNQLYINVVYWSDISDPPTLGALAALNTIDYTSNYITNKPTLASVATSGSYNDLTGHADGVKADIGIATSGSTFLRKDGQWATPTNTTYTFSVPLSKSSGNVVSLNYGSGLTLDGGSTLIIDDSHFGALAALNSIDYTSNYITNKPTLATVATSGSYNDLTNKPTIPVIPSDNVTGSGTYGYLAKWNGTNSLTNGLVYTEAATANTIVARNGSGNSVFNHLYSNQITVGYGESVTGDSYIGGLRILRQNYGEDSDPQTYLVPYLQYAPDGDNEYGTTYLGASWNPWKYIYGDAITGNNILPNAHNSGTVGASNLYWQDIYTYNLWCGRVVEDDTPTDYVAYFNSSAGYPNVLRKKSLWAMANDIGRANTPTGPRDFHNGTLIVTDVTYVDWGYILYLEIKSDNYTTSYETVDTRVKIYCGDHGWYVGNSSCVSHYGYPISYIKVFVRNSDNKICFWFPTQGYWISYSVTCYAANYNFYTNRAVSIEDAEDPSDDPLVDTNYRYIMTLNTAGVGEVKSLWNCDNLVPHDHATYDLGSYSTRFQDLYLSRYAYVQWMNCSCQIEDNYTLSAIMYSDEYGWVRKRSVSSAASGLLSAYRGGTSGQILISGGSNAAPSWTNQSAIHAGKADKDGSGWTLAGNYAHSLSVSGNTLSLINMEGDSLDDVTLPDRVSGIRNGSSGNFYSGQIELVAGSGMTISRYTFPTTGITRFTFDCDATCLIEGTRIKMADGTEKNIEDVREGDLLLSFDPNTGENCEAVCIGNDRTGISDDYISYFFDNGEMLTIFGKHCIYNNDIGTAKEASKWEIGQEGIGLDRQPVMYIGSEELHYAGRKRHYDLRSSNMLYYANGILNATSLTWNYYKHHDNTELPESYRNALLEDYNSSASLHTHQTTRAYGQAIAPILKEIRRQEKLLKENQTLLDKSDYIVNKFTEGLVNAVEWLKAKKDRANWRTLRDAAETAVNAAKERLKEAKKPYKASQTRRERFAAAVARDNACLDDLKAYYNSQEE